MRSSYILNWKSEILKNSGSRGSWNLWYSIILFCYQIFSLRNYFNLCRVYLKLLMLRVTLEGMCERHSIIKEFTFLRRLNDFRYTR